MNCAKDIMSHDVVYLSPEDSIFDAVKLFLELDIRGVPVLEGRKIVGILTIADILEFIDLKLKGPINLPVPPGIPSTVFSLVATLVEGKKFEQHLSDIVGLKVKDFMRKNPITIKKTTRIIEILRIMSEKGFNRIPVVSRGNIVGIVTGSDVMRALFFKRKREATHRKIIQRVKNLKRKNSSARASHNGK